MYVGRVGSIKSLVLIFAGVCLLTGPLSGCLTAVEETIPLPVDDGANGGVTVGVKTDPSVCDPFPDPFERNSTLNENPDLGIVGHMRNLDHNDLPHMNAKDGEDMGSPSEVVLSMNRVYLVSRRSIHWKTYDQSHEISDPNPAIYLQLNTELRIPNANAAGAYQFALLSHGAVMEVIDQTENATTVVNNDGYHPLRIACADQPLQVTDAPLKVRIHSFSGPGNMVSLILLWRPWNPNNHSCDQNGGNGSWFQQQANLGPFVPKKKIVDLLKPNPGWSIVPKEAFHMPEEYKPNHCPSPPPPPLPEPTPTPTPTATPAPTPTPTPTSTPDPVTTTITDMIPAASVTSQNSISFSFNSNYANATFTCQLDDGQPSACASPKAYSNLANGTHLFFVWATNEEDVTDMVGASYSWTVDQANPQITFIQYTATPSTITIQWTTNEPTTTKVLWGPTSATTNLIPENNVYSTSHSVMLENLDPDTAYFFRVAGTDQAGNPFLSSLQGIVTEP